MSRIQHLLCLVLFSGLAPGTVLAGDAPVPTTMPRLADKPSWVIGDASAPAAPAPPPAPTVERPTGRYETGWLTLRGAAGPQPMRCCRTGQESARNNSEVADSWCTVDRSIDLFLAFRGGQGVQVWFTGVQIPGGPKPQGTAQFRCDANRLRLAQGSIAGTLDMRLVSIWAPIQRLASFTVTIAAQRTGGEVVGTWALAGNDCHAEGDLQGSVSDSVALAQADPVADGADWPSYWGRAGTARAVATSTPLVDDAARIRPLWRSEESLPCAWGSQVDGRYAQRAALGTIGGGASSPVIAGGRIYHYFYRPSGPLNPTLEAETRKFSDNPAEQAAYADFYRTRADVVLLCTDLATGRTVWKSTWPLKSANYQTHKWRGLNPTPAVAADSVLVADYTHRTYAYDAATGQLRWEYGGVASQQVQGNRASSGPLVFRRVVVAQDVEATVGLDLQTGEELWRVRGFRDGKRWVTDAQERLLMTISAYQQTPNQIVCLDPADGTEQWRGTVDLDLEHQLPAVVGNLLLGYQSLRPDPKDVNDFVGVATAYRLAHTGLAKAWSSDELSCTDVMGLAADERSVFISGSREVRCLDLATGKPLAKVVGVGGARTHHLQVVGSRLILDPEGRHGKTTLFLLTSDPQHFRVLGDPWSGGYPTTTAYANMPIHHPVADGRLVMKGHDGLYTFDLRAE